MSTSTYNCENCGTELVGKAELIVGLCVGCSNEVIKEYNERHGQLLGNPGYRSCGCEDYPSCGH